MLRTTTATAALLAVAALIGCAPLGGRTVEVTFKSRDGVALAGTLALPRGARGPVPAIILLHGAEAATRGFAYRMHANIFLDRGMAVLIYDKRGAGESGGDHESATFAQLIEDGLAAVRFLRARKEIDPLRLGLVGASQSGWITPEIAERAGDIAFIINKVGPCSSWRETVEWEVYHEIRKERGVTDESARQQAALYERIWAYHVSPSADERTALEAILDKWALRKDSHLPTELEPPRPARLEHMAYDPTPFLERGTPPILYVYGSEDVNVPTADCVERLTRLRREGKLVSFHVFEGAGHELGGVGLTGYNFVKGYADLLGDFAEKYVGGRQAG